MVVPTIHHKRVADHKACGRAAKPKNGISDLLRPTKAGDGYVFQHRVKRVTLAVGHHLTEPHRQVADNLMITAVGLLSFGSSRSPKRTSHGGIQNSSWHGYLPMRKTPTPCAQKNRAITSLDPLLAPMKMTFR